MIDKKSQRFKRKCHTVVFLFGAREKHKMAQHNLLKMLKSCFIYFKIIHNNVHKMTMYQLNGPLDICITCINTYVVRI